MTPSEIAALGAAAANIGGWIFAAVVVTSVLVFLLRAWIRGDFVPRSLHERVLNANDALTEAMKQQTAAITTLTQRFEDWRSAPASGRR